MMPVQRVALSIELAYQDAQTVPRRNELVPLAMYRATASGYGTQLPAALLYCPSARVSDQSRRYRSFQPEVALLAI